MHTISDLKMEKASRQHSEVSTTAPTNIFSAQQIKNFSNFCSNRAKDCSREQRTEASARTKAHTEKTTKTKCSVPHCNSM